MNFHGAREILNHWSSFFDPSVAEASSNKKPEPAPRSEADRKAWWYENDRIIDWRSPRCSAYLVAYLQIADGPIPLTGIALDDGFLHPDRSVMQALDHAGCVRMVDGMFHLTEKGEALVTPWLQINRDIGFSVTMQRRRG
jgi:hypothetical protein